jgi:hypothetical protein
VNGWRGQRRRRRRRRYGQIERQGRRLVQRVVVGGSTNDGAGRQG